MKRILITGANSYIGTSVEEWLLKEPDKYYIETLDMKDPNWKEFDFSKFDVVYHVAGIAHIKETKKNKDLYYKVNRDLAFETAKKAKESNVKQFIFLSTMSVYGLSKGVITKDTIPKPKDAYGKSKYEAEQLIKEVETKDFGVTILRPPMVYGPGSPGNYQRLSKLALKLPFYPKINNQRSMLFIDNLAIYIKYYIDNQLTGLYLPQNEEYVNTTNLITTIREIHGKKKRETRVFNWLVYIVRAVMPQINKIFGDLNYELNINLGIKLIELEQSIISSEENNG